MRSKSYPVKAADGRGVWLETGKAGTARSDRSSSSGSPDSLETVPEPCSLALPSLFPARCFNFEVWQNNRDYKMNWLSKWASAIFAVTVAGGSFFVAAYVSTSEQFLIPIFALLFAAGITFNLLRDISRSNESTLSLVIQTASLGAFLIFLYAAAYRALGIIDTAAPVADAAGAKAGVGLADSIYFSIITWTTTGYGDFRPDTAARLVAASEALLGYIVMAIIIGITARPFKKSSELKVSSKCVCGRTHTVVVQGEVLS
jgi:voltage-gated potassium channel Kch